MITETPTTEAEKDFKQTVEALATEFGSDSYTEGRSAAIDAGCERLAEVLTHYGKVIQLAGRHTAAWDKANVDMDAQTKTLHEYGWAVSNNGLPMTSEAMKAHRLASVAARINEARNKRYQSLQDYLMELASDTLQHIEETQTVMHYASCSQRSVHSVDDASIVTRSARLDMEMAGFSALERSVKGLIEEMSKERYFKNKPEVHTDNIEAILTSFYKESLSNLFTVTKTLKRLRLEHEQ